MGNCGTLFLETGSKTSQYKKLGKVNQNIFRLQESSLVHDAFVYGGFCKQKLFFAFENNKEREKEDGTKKSDY